MKETKKEQREREERERRMESYKPEVRKLLEPRLRTVEEMIENVKSNWPGVPDDEKARLILAADRIANDTLERFAYELLYIDENIARVRASVERINAKQHTEQLNQVR